MRLPSSITNDVQIVLRISRLDPEDPTGTKRRHFEISIDSPFTVLNCKAIQANTSLPAYSGPVSQPPLFQSACGCPDSRMSATGPSPSSSTGTLLDGDAGDALPAPPQAAHLHMRGTHPASGGSQSPAPDTASMQQDARPIHLLRVPSFNPPAFDEDTAPPPAPPQLVQQNSGPAEESIMTPPPQYDVVVGTPSVDGMADYFTRLASYGFEGHEDDSGSDEDSPARLIERTGRVNVANPRTPGGRMPSRSLEISRPNIDLHLERNGVRDTAA
jgi:hypothetical protein